MENCGLLRIIDSSRKIQIFVTLLPIYYLFNSKAELKGLVLAALTQEIDRNPQIEWVRSDKDISKYATQKDCIQDLKDIILIKIYIIK